MKKKLTLISIIIMMAYLFFSSCSFGEGDRKDKNLQHAMLEYLESIPEVEYVGMSDVHDLDDDRFQAVIIYYVTDSEGNQTERNARVTTNEDCSQILTWEDLDTNILDDTKQLVSDKFKENGLNLDGSLIDALIKLKNN